jgi:SAM-dependent methyltransferase
MSITEYVAAVKKQGSHQGKVHVFLLLLRDVFGVDQSEYELELPTQSSRLQVRGRIDTVVGDVLFEFKTKLPRELGDAEEQLSKYLAVFHEQHPARPCVGVATDGVSFHVYRPVFQNGEAALEAVEQAGLDKLDDEGALLWLDRYLFRRSPKKPTEEDVSKRFGPESPTCKVAMAWLRGWWQRVKSETGVELKYDLWSKQLTVVYGEGVGTEELFLQHTYLATLAKLLAGLAFGQPLHGIEAVLTGAHFQAAGIQNFVEEDLFSWPLHPAVRREGTRFAERLSSQLAQYDPGGFDEDVLKGLYQELVDPKVRHDLGEYYTPDWLAQFMLNRVLDGEATQRILDPACGSGTFLFLAIRLLVSRLRKARWSAQKILSHIESHIYGVDVHPLAVLVARTNYLLACAPLLPRRKEAFTVGVYLGDSLISRSMTGAMAMEDVEVKADGESLWFPERLASDAAGFDRLISSVVHWASEGGEGREGFEAQMEREGFKGREREGLRKTFGVLRKLMEEGRDSIWGFVTRNLVRPYILSKGAKFDVVIGNPPWLSLRYMKSPEYQAFVKRRMDALHIKPKGAKLVTQLDLGALFFAECSHLYLRQGGTIAFVMPRAAMGGRQYLEFDKFQFASYGMVQCTEVVDLEGVEPLFNIPACVIVARRGDFTSYPVDALQVAGRLRRKNASWEEAQPVLTVTSGKWSLGKEPAGVSYYHERFRQGATLVPRRFWFVRFVAGPTLGINPAAPAIESDDQVPAKPPWHVRQTGTVEAEFLWACALPADIVPFGVGRLRPVLVPIRERTDGSAEVLDAAAARAKGRGNLGGWLQRAESVWAENRTSTRLSLIGRINYVRELANQFPRRGRYVVLYTKSATYLAGAVVDREAKFEFQVDGQSVGTVGLIVDHTTYWWATDDEMEAHYLCAWLNSPAVDKAIKWRQSRGLFGARDIHKLPLELPLPEYDGKDARHRRLAELAEEARAVVAEILPEMAGGRAGIVRRHIRNHPKVAPLLDKIAKLTVKIAPGL